MPAVQRSTRVNESIISADLGTESVLLNVETGIYFGLDEVGAEIWGQLVQGRSEDQIVDRLLDAYDVDRATLAADVATFLDTLEARGILRRDG